MNIHKEVFKFNEKYNNLSVEEIIDKFNKKWAKRIELILKFTKQNEKEATSKFLENKKYEEYITLLIDLNIVIPFPNDLLIEMNKIIVEGKTLKEHFIDSTTRGKCYSMSTALSLIFEDNFVLNRGIINKPLISFKHQWLEYDDKVYDTTFHLIFPKEYYYNIYCPINIHKLTESEIEEIKNNIFNRMKKM